MSDWCWILKEITLYFNNMSQNASDTPYPHFFTEASLGLPGPPARSSLPCEHCLSVSGTSFDSHWHRWSAAIWCLLLTWAPSGCPVALLDSVLGKVSSNAADYLVNTPFQTGWSNKLHEFSNHPFLPDWIIAKVYEFIGMLVLATGPSCTVWGILRSPALLGGDQNRERSDWGKDWWSEGKGFMVRGKSI